MCFENSVKQQWESEHAICSWFSCCASLWFVGRHAVESRSDPLFFILGRAKKLNFGKGIFQEPSHLTGAWGQSPPQQWSICCLASCTEWVSVGFCRGGWCGKGGAWDHISASWSPGQAISHPVTSFPIIHFSLINYNSLTIWHLYLMYVYSVCFPTLFYVFKVLEPSCISPYIPSPQYKVPQAVDPRQIINWSELGEGTLKLGKYTFCKTWRS